MAAELFGITPDEWDAKPVKSRAEMMAYVEIKGLITEYRSEPDETS